MQKSDFGLDDRFEILPASWPDDAKARSVLPGDLTQFAVNRGPQTTDLATFHPFRADPKLHGGGGVIYFDEGIERDQLTTVLGLMGVAYTMTDFAIFADCSDDPAQQDYLAQMRLVSHHALESGYFAYQKLPVQPASVLDVIAGFIERQREIWNPGHHPFPSSLRFTRGGDGDSVKEALGYGFMVEDTEWQIYRVWSRSWLVPK